MCETCSPFEAQIPIHGPEQFRRIVRNIRTAVDDGLLRCIANESPGDMVEQTSFMNLDLGRPWPSDHLQYEFLCPTCRTRFLLEVETYHGQGGEWRRV